MLRTQGSVWGGSPLPSLRTRVPTVLPPGSLASSQSPVTVQPYQVSEERAKEEDDTLCHQAGSSDEALSGARHTLL